MTKYVLLLVTSLISMSAFAVKAGNYKCTPSAKNTFFTDKVNLEVISAKEIKVNNVKLDYDPTYSPKDDTIYTRRYIGDTSGASGWMDSGNVEIFMKPVGASLKFTVRGETYVPGEYFSCH